MRNNNQNKHILAFASAMAMVMVGFGCSDANLKAVKPQPLTVKLEIQNYCPASGFIFKDFFAHNANVAFDTTNQWVTDADGDGLSDKFEQALVNFNFYNIDWRLSDSIGNGYSDLVKVRLNLSGSQQLAMPICPNPGVDTDRDGLSDCEEQLLGTDPKQADNDLDGIPDGLEIRFGMNPVDPNDAYTSMAGDQYTNTQKIKWGIPVSTFLTSDSLNLMMNYASSLSAPPASSSSSSSSSSGICYLLDVSNIPVMSLKNGNGNLIQVTALEDAQLPTSGGIHSVDREARTLSVLVPSNIKAHSTVVVPDGIHGQFVDGVNIPLIIVGGSGS